MSLLAQTRPQKAAEIVDASFRFYRAHFGELVMLAAVLLTPAVLLAALVPSPYDRVINFAGNLLYPVCQGAIAVIIAAALERDRMISVGEAFRELGGRAGSTITVAILSNFFVFLGLLLLVVPGVIVLAWTAVVVPVVAIEGLGGMAAVNRSRELVRGQVGRVLGTIVFSWLLLFILVFGGAMTIGAVCGMFGINPSIGKLLGSLLMIPLFPLIGVVTALLYYDLRIRHEGADVAAMIGEMPPSAEPAVTH